MTSDFWVWETAQIPEPHRDQRISEWQVHSQATHTAAQLASHVIATWPERFRGTTTRADRSMIGQGVGLYGTPGTGKTTLACMILTELRLTHKATVMYYETAKLVNHLRAAEGGRADARTAKRIRRLDTVHALALDDVGKEYRTDSGYVGKKLNELLRTRHGSGLPTLVMTNEPFERWAEMYDKALSSFVHEAFLIASLAGKDMRRG